MCDDISKEGEELLAVFHSRVLLPCGHLRSDEFDKDGDKVDLIREHLLCSLVLGLVRDRGQVLHDRIDIQLHCLVDLVDRHLGNYRGNALCDLLLAAYRQLIKVFLVELLQRNNEVDKQAGTVVAEELERECSSANDVLCGVIECSHDVVQLRL
jgi:hypothetical protein